MGAVLVGFGVADSALGFAFCLGWSIGRLVEWARLFPDAFDFSEAFMIGGCVAGFGFGADSLAFVGAAAGVGESTPGAAIPGATPDATENADAAGRGIPGGFATLLMTSITSSHLFANSVLMPLR